MMSCDVPIRERLARHYEPHLGWGKTTIGGLPIGVRCPVSDRRSLTIPAGKD